MTDGAGSAGERADDDRDDDAADESRVSVRGIYATALTRLVEDADACRVVQASGPIRDRFDADLPATPADAAVETTDDRQGVGVHGAAGAVDTVEPVVRGVGVDALAWREALPRGAVFDGRVTDTVGGGAVVDCGDGEGYLPFDAADSYVEEGDAVRVQVRDPRPPWTDGRAELDAAVEVGNGLARLVRGAPGGGASVDLAQLLPEDPLDGWGVRWDARADDADMDALAAALSGLNERAEAVEAALADPVGEPGRLTDGAASLWVWFGRESRFALDDARRRVTATMPGHHRVKAATDAASAAVDFAEAVCAPGEGASDDADPDFPFAVVSRQFGPREGDRLAIEHGKPSGRCITLGRGEVTALDDGGTATVERQMSPGGTYDALGVERRAGDVAVTKLVEGRWWYPTVYRGSDGERRGTYVNICTPVELFPDAARYVDLHVDVVKHADGTVERVDDDELDEAVAAGHVPEPLAEKARAVASAVERALSN